MKKRWIAAVIFSLLCVAAVILVCTFFGAADITIKETLILLTNKMKGLMETEADAM